MTYRFPRFRPSLKNGLRTSSGSHLFQTRKCLGTVAYLHFFCAFMTSLPCSAFSGIKLPGIKGIVNILLNTNILFFGRKIFEEVAK